MTVFPPPPPVPHTQYSADRAAPAQPLHLLITPILKAALRRKKQILDRDLPNLLGLGSEPAPPPPPPSPQHPAPQPVQASSVMYYLPPPDLSSGRERSRAVRKNNYVPRVTKLLPEDYFDAGFDVATNEIEVNDSINNVEKEEDFKDEQDVSLTTAINLSPTDTIIVDLSGTSDDYGADEGYNEFMETEDEFDEDGDEATTDPTDFESKRVESDADSAEVWKYIWHPHQLITTHSTKCFLIGQ